ncbi:uncharacterized protein LOC113746661 [Larimichthys crocea]|uniref:uncharacterized protein LOC113746661 n=1 Tax=Larimichthys crocea TaxID=215358 RepID=UPI000F5D92A8|nr:uncharacterized protein LOC113746661 [Larimichthys crocea]
MEVVLSSRSPSPHSPHVVQKQQSYTQIIPQPILKFDEPTQDNKKFRSLEFSPDDRSAAVNKCDQSPVDCSPEVSWLIPSTPLQHRRSMTSSSSTQTKSSMCRTQLFPKGDPSSLSVFSSPALPHTPQTSESPTRVSAHSGPTEGSAPRLKHPCSSSLELNLSPKGTSSCDVSKDKKKFAAPPSQCKRTHPSSSFSSKQDTPLHLQPHPYSSTPLHTEIHQPHSLLATSPLHISLDKQTSASQGKDSASSDSPDKTELGSFHLSPLSDPSGPPSSSSHRVLQSSQRHSDDPHQSPEFKMRGIKDEEREMECQNKDRGDDGEQEEVKAESGVAEVAESSFQQSFMAMDEPPIAFNDSWGLDACVDANPGCFSLKLEDSRGSSQQEHSPGQRKTTRSPSSTDCQPSPSTHNVRLLNGHGKGVTTHSSQPRTSEQAHTGSSFTPSPPDPTTRTTPQISSSLLDSKIWDSWEEEEEEEAPPLSQRVNPSAHFRTPASSHNKRRRTLVPITPMPHYSDMDTPELKNKLNRFGVRPLPKRQMVLKLKEIHQYTHQLTSSDSEDEECISAGRAAPMKPPPTSSVAAGNRPLSSTQTVKFKEPLALAATSPVKRNKEEEGELLSASQGSNTSSTAASEESERSNPELCVTSDSDSDDSDITASQVATRLQDRLQAVRSFILSDSRLYTQILQYQPLVLSQLQQQLKATGIRLGAAKLMDYLDSQCITFTTAKPGRSAPSRRRGKKSGKVAKAAGDSGASRKRASLHNKRRRSLVPITPMTHYSDKDTLELKNKLSRSNPELCLSSDSDSDGSDISASTHLQDRLRAVRSFILSDSRLYTQILQYQPLVLSQLQQQLKAAGIRLGAAKLMDYLDSQCITFTTAELGQSAPSYRQGKGAKAAGESSRKRAPMKPPPTNSVAAGNRPLSSAQTVKFKEPLALAATSPLKHNREEEAELLSVSQGSNTSATAASEESERSNSELYSCTTAASDSDSGIYISQGSTRLQDRLQAVRSFILSDSRLYTQILQYQPLVLSQLQQQLKEVGIRLGTTRLMDYLDSQCITFTTAELGHSASSSLPSFLGGQEGGKSSGCLHRKVAGL